MIKREKSVVLGIIAVCAAGIIFMTLNRYSFYQDFIDLSPSPEPSKLAREHASEDSEEKDAANHKQLPEEMEEVAFHEKININTAGLVELETLPGIGRVTALNIIDYRTNNGPFTEYDDLIKVKGIGEKKLEMLRQYVNIR